MHHNNGVNDMRRGHLTMILCRCHLQQATALARPESVRLAVAAHPLQTKPPQQKIAVPGNSAVSLEFCSVPSLLDPNSHVEQSKTRQPRHSKS